MEHIIDSMPFNWVLLLTIVGVVVSYIILQHFIETVKRCCKQFVNALLSVKDASVLIAELVKILISEIVLHEDRRMEIRLSVP